MRFGASVGVALALCSALVPAQAFSATRSYALTCTGFMRDFPLALPSFRVSFERPLTITRDLLDGEDGVDVHILSTNAEVDGTLKCKGDAVARFELRVASPADAEVDTNFRRFQQAALATAFKWDPARTNTIVAALTSDADEYLRASIERGDTFHSGKVEYHQGVFDFGAIWTETDRTLVISSQTSN